jgi:hypothetical protein
MIAMGHCPDSNGVQFCNPTNGTFVSSIDYKVEHNSTNGARFGYQFQPGTFIYHLDESASIFIPNSEVSVHTHSPPHRAKVIGIPSCDCPYNYTVLFSNRSIAEFSENFNIP